MRLAAQRAGVPFGALARSCRPLPPKWLVVQPFATARVTDASRQASVQKTPPRRRSTDDASENLFVPEVTQEQKQTGEAKKKAQDAFVAAQKAAGEAAAVATILKKVADDAAATKHTADEAVIVAKKAADDAWMAKRKADEHALGIMKDAASKEKTFLKNAFQNWDTDQVGYLASGQIRTVLEDLKLPAEGGDVDDLVQVLDTAKDNVVHLSEWTDHMPQEIRQALRTHALASQWDNK